MGKKSVLPFKSNFLKMVRDTMKKLSHLKENCLKNDMMPILWKSFHRTGVAITITKIGYARLSFICAWARSGHLHAQGTSERDPEFGSHPLSVVGCTL